MEKDRHPSLFETYGQCGKACSRVWPLFLLKCIFFVFQYATLFFCLVFLLGPFVSRNLDRFVEGLKHFQQYDWSGILEDWVQMITNPTWILIALGLFLLYSLWWLFLWAIENGGVYGTFFDLLSDGKLFSLGRFFQWGFEKFFPMIWLQFWLFLIVMVPFLFWSVVGLLVLGLMALTGFQPVVVGLLGVLAGSLFLLFWIAFSFCFGGVVSLSKAYVIRGTGSWDSIKAAYGKFRKEGWRAGVGFVVALAIYTAGSTAIRMIFMVLGFLPILGILFKVLDLFVVMALALSLLLFLSGLGVIYVQEEAGN